MSTPLRERPDAPLGTLIFRAGLLPAETIENALEEGVRTGRRLGEILIERGLLREDDLAPLLAGQKGLRFVRLAEEGVDAAAARLLAEDQARLFQALPIGYDANVPLVAVTDPTNETLMRNLREALGGEARLVVVTRADLNDAIGRVYGQNGNHAAETDAQSAVPLLAPAEAEPEPDFVAEAAPQPEPELVPPSAPTPAAELAPEPEAPAPQVPLAAPEPEPEPEPALSAPEPEPVSEPAPSAPEPEPEPEPAPSAPVADAPPAPVETPAAPPEAGPETVLSFLPPVSEPEPPKPAFRVTIRLANDEPFVVAECGDLDEAKEQAQDIIRQLAEAAVGDWPFVNGRFLKPDSIVSVDVERL